MSYSSCAQIKYFGAVAVWLSLSLAGHTGEPPAKSTVAIPIADIKRNAPVDFEKDILPLLKSNCLACHNQTTTKADLILETPQTILKGGENGPAVVPGKSSESLLLRAASHQVRPNMPPKDNKVAAVSFTPDELGLLKLWIDQGAKGEVHAAGPIEWQALPEGLNPIYSVALTPDGQFAACGRANQIFVYHLPSAQLVSRLADPSLVFPGQKLGAAHRDLVHSLAFHPDGTLLASGGYREIKLWQRPVSVEKLRLASTASNAVQCLALSLDGKWAATAGAGAAITLWEMPAGRSAKVLAGSEKGTSALQFSPDGTRFYSGSPGQSLAAWSLPDGALLAQTNLPAPILSLALIDQGKQIAVGGADNLIRLWQVPSATNAQFQALRELKGHAGPVTALETIGAKGDQFLSGSADGSVRQWNVAKGESIREMKHGGPVAAVAVRPDGKRFASAGPNSLARLWDAEKGTQIAEFKGDRYAQEKTLEVERSAASATAEVAYRKTALQTAETQNKAQVERVAKATQSYTNAEKTFLEKQLSLTNAVTAKAASEKALVDLNAEIKKVTDQFQSADQMSKQSADSAKALIEKAAQAKLAADQAAQAKAEAERLAADAAAVAAKAKTVDATLAGNADKAALGLKALADSAATNAVVRGKAVAEARTLADKAIDEVVAKAFAAGQVKVAYDKLMAEAPEKRKQATNQVNTATKTLGDAEGEFKKVAQAKSIAENELTLAKGSAKQTDEALAEAKATLQKAEAGQKTTEGALVAAKKSATDLEQPVRALAFSPDNRTLASAGDDRNVHTWSAENGKAFEVLHGHAGPVHALVFAGSGLLLSGAADRNAVLWDLAPEWKLVRTIGNGGPDSPLADRVNVLRFSADGKYLASGGGEPTRGSEIKLWQVNDGKLWQEFKNVHSDAVLALEFSPDGKYLASGAADKFAKVVEIATGKIARSFEGHTHHVLGVSWKSDGRTLVSSGADNVLKVWDFVSGERKKTIEGFNKEVTSVSFLSNTDQAVASSGDNQVRIVRDNGDNVRSLGGGTDFMYSSAATADGKIVVAGGADSFLRVWDAGDGKVLGAFAPPEAH